MLKKKTMINGARVDPGVLDREFNLPEGRGFVQFDQFFLKFPMKME